MEWPRITGDCWLGCGRTGVLVIWLGPVQWDGQHAPFYHMRAVPRSSQGPGTRLLHGAATGIRLIRLPAHDFPA